MCRKTVLFLFVMLSLLSCNSKLYFTPAVKNQLLGYNQPIEQVQFYIDKKISLRNQTVEVDSIGNKTYKNKIIKIRRNTPGLCITNSDTVLMMQFEKGNENSLLFGVGAKLKPNDHYSLMAFNWTKSSASVKYEDLVYNMSLRDAFASLKIKKSLLKRLERDEVNKRIIKGLRINEINPKK